MIPTKQRPSVPQPMHAPEPEGQQPQTSDNSRKVWTYVAVAVGAAAVAGAIVYFLTKDKERSTDDEVSVAAEYEDIAMESLPVEEWEEVEAAELEEVPAEIISVEEVEAVAPVEEVKEAPTVDPNAGTEDVNVDRGYRSDVVEEAAPAVDEDKVFTTVEQMPQFPGGEAALLQYIGNHIQYPAMAQENGVQGRVVVQFVVRRDGSVGDVKVARGKDPELDREAVRVVRTLPNFIPGKSNGQAVNVWYTLPITFKLQSV